MKLLKTGCGCLLSVILFAIAFISVYSVWYRPSDKKARYFVSSTFRYALPASTELIYSKNYWTSFDNREPRSMCFAFRYSKEDFAKLQKTDFTVEANSQYRFSPVSGNKGCGKWKNSLQANSSVRFVKHFEILNPLRGGTIFIDKKNRIVLYEIYLFD